MNIKNSWQKIPSILQYLLIATPFIAVIYTLFHLEDFTKQFLDNKELPLWLLIYIPVGQSVFTFRFVYQWSYSHKQHQSILPLGFWAISLAGALIIVSYGLIRKDPVLILGQSIGLITYSRNVRLIYRSKKEKSEETLAHA